MSWTEVCYHRTSYLERIMALLRATIGVFILEDLDVKRSLESCRVKIERLEEEREVKLTLPEGWYLVPFSTTNHVIYNSQDQPLFITHYSYNAVPAQGWIKCIKDSSSYRSDNSQNRIEIQPLNKGGTWASSLLWEKVPGLIFICTEDGQETLAEMKYYYQHNYIRLRQLQNVGTVKLVEDKDEYYYNETRNNNFVPVSQMFFDLQKSCISTIIRDKRLFDMFPKVIPSLLTRRVVLVHLLDQVNCKSFPIEWNFY